MSVGWGSYLTHHFIHHYTRAHKGWRWINHVKMWCILAGHIHAESVFIRGDLSGWCWILWRRGAFSVTFTHAFGWLWTTWKQNTKKDKEGGGGGQGSPVLLVAHLSYLLPPVFQLPWGRLFKLPPKLLLAGAFFLYLQETSRTCYL